MIGDQFRLWVEVTKDQMQVIGFPALHPDSLGGMEILRESGPDTLQIDGRRITLRKEYLMTSFDEGIYRMGRFPVLYVDKNITDTIWSRDSIGITVHTLPVDTLTQKIYDIKPPLRAPLRFGEIGGYLLILLAVLALVVLLIRYLRRRRKNRTVSGPQAPQEPAHVTAIRALQKVHAQKLWQSGKHKQYYTRITDILREYMEHRYGFKAMEMTSDEILDRLKTPVVAARDYRNLTDILRTADLVKFAKYVPDADQNETVYNNAYFFVEETKNNEPSVPYPQAAELPLSAGETGQTSAQTVGETRGRGGRKQ